MDELHQEILGIWHKFDSLPVPLPSHRNRTLTAWGTAISEALPELTRASNRAFALQNELRRANEHVRALSAEIERLRGENRLILAALGMEKYRVRWRPVSDEGFKNAMGEEMLIVYDGPVWVTRLIMISRWSPVAGWNLRNGNPVADGTVTHWAPLPGLPEID